VCSSDLSYTRLERHAEESLLRLDRAPEREAVLSSLLELHDTLESIVAKAGRLCTSYQRQLEISRAADTKFLDEALTEHQRYRSQASYLAGYTALYVARLSRERSASAARAIVHFATVLNAPKGEPLDPSRIQPNLLAFDHVARAALGIGIASALKPDLRTAGLWFDLLEDADELSESVAADLPAARLRAFAVANRWREAFAALDARGSDLFSPIEARRLAVIVFEGSALAVEQESREALAQRALSDLIAQGETGHVLQLVGLYDITEINPSGFVGTYVRALERYEQSREAHRVSEENAASPTRDAELASAYARAGDEFTNSLGASDVHAYPDAEGSVRMLAGLSYFYAGARHRNLVNASEQFRLASVLLHKADPVRAANAQWMAIRSIEMHIEAGLDDLEEMSALRDKLLTDFLTRYPEHPRSTSIAYERAISGDLDPTLAVDELLRIPKESLFRLPAQRHAARILYEQITASGAEADRWRRTLFLDLAESLLEIDLRDAMSGLEDPADANREAALRSAFHARRLFEVSLLWLPHDEARAERAIDALASLASLGLVEIESLDAELHYDRARLYASRGDLESARAESDRAGEADPRFAHAGDRLVFKQAFDAWERATESEMERRAELATGVIDAGRPILRELLSAQAGDAALDDPASLTVASGEIGRAHV